MAKQLSLEFNPGYGRCANTDVLFELFEQHNQAATEAGYDLAKFNTLINQMIMAHTHLLGIHSPELDAFIAERQKEQALIKDSSQEEQDEFWRSKLIWLEQQNILENWLLQLENQREEYFLAVRKINPREIGLDGRSLPQLLEILDKVEAIWESMGLDIHARQVIRGESLKDQLAWLQKENQRIEQEVAEIRNDFKLLCDEPEIREQATSLKSVDSVKKGLEEQLAQSEAEAAPCSRGVMTRQPAPGT